jgi:uncharacterized protein YjgD (DUF1641 family)
VVHVSETTTNVDADRNGELQAAIEENPEAVARFLERLDVVNELIDVLELGTDALDDEMVAELSGTAATLAESADGMATEETVKLAESVGQNGGDLAEAMEAIVELQRTGTLDELTAMADVISLGADALDDEMVVTLARTGSTLGEVADTAADEDTARGIATLLRAVGEASDPDVPPEQVGAWGMMKAMRDPEVKTGLGYLIALARGLGRNIEHGDQRTK